MAGKPAAVRRLWALAAAAAVAAGFAWRLSNAWNRRGAQAPCAAPQEEYFLSSVLLLSDGVYTLDPGGEPQARRGPLYTTFLAMTQAGAPRPDPRRASLAQAFLGLLAALAAWGLGVRLRSPAAGAAAAAAVSLTPGLAASVTTLNVHAFYGVVVLVIGCAAAEWARRKGDRTSGALLGLALGAGLLCRTAHLAALPLLAAAAWAWWGRAGLKRAAWVLGVTAAALVPWVLRDYAHAGRLVLLDTGMGAYNLLSAADGRDGALTIGQAFALAELKDPAFAAQRFAVGSREGEEALAGVARRMILRDPLGYAGGSIRRLARFWRPLWLYLLLAALAALWPGAPDGTKAAALVAASFSLYAAVGQGVDYRLGVETLLAALAGVGLATLLERRPPAPRGPNPLRAALPAAAAVALTALVCLAVTPFDAYAARRAGLPHCEPPSPFLLSFLDDGVKTCGPEWSHAHWAGDLRARPQVCAGMDAYAAGDPASAARAFRAAASFAPADPEIRLNLAVALGASGDRASARREAARAASLLTPESSPGLRRAVLSTEDGFRRRVLK